MMESNHFDPFNNRLCRNVRNALSEGFKEVLDKKEMQPVNRIAGFFQTELLPVYVMAYIRQRLTAYEQVLSHVTSHNIEDPLAIAAVVWDWHLFFETHEFLESYWMTATGDEKRMLQAFIRAAGTYVHLEQGNLAAAKRIAAKAICVLEEFSDQLAPFIDVHQLLAKLKALDPLPPRLSRVLGV